MPTDQQIQIPADVRGFLENLLEDSGLQLTPELKEAMVGDLYQRLEKKLISDAVEKMQPDEVEAFINMIQSDSSKEELEKYISDHVPNAKEVFVQSLTDFRSYFLEGVTDQSQSPQS